MRRAFFTWLLNAAVATIALFVARAIMPGRQELLLDIYVLALGGLSLLVVASVLGLVAPREQKSQLEEAMETKPPEPVRIAELDRLERTVALAASRDFDLHTRLRPVLREIAASRLQRREIELDSGSPGARELLGDELWSLTAPDREVPADRLAPGPGLAQIERTVERLERL